MKSPDGEPGVYDYVFGTANGFFIVDTPSGSILGLPKASTKDFDPVTAGIYNAIYYEKTGASTGAGNVQTGSPSLGKATIVVSATGAVTVTDPQGNVVTQATLTPIADASYLYGSGGQLTDPCNGMRWLDCHRAIPEAGRRRNSLSIPRPMALCINRICSAFSAAYECLTYTSNSGGQPIVDRRSV
jgi:hypothetical protein